MVVAVPVAVVVSPSLFVRPHVGMLMVVACDDGGAGRTSAGRRSSKNGSSRPVLGTFVNKCIVLPINY